MGSITVQNGKEKLLEQATCLEAAAYCVKIWKGRLNLPEQVNISSKEQVDLYSISYYAIQSKIWLHREPADQVPSLEALLLKYKRTCEAFFLCSAAEQPCPIVPQSDMSVF